jgi:hypothetical protein
MGTPAAGDRKPPGPGPRSTLASAGVVLAALVARERPAAMQELHSRPVVSAVALEQSCGAHTRARVHHL